jgi:D-alanine-D-alanine ligase
MNSSNQNILNVALVFGGRSAEHEISVLSAKNVFEALDKTKFIPHLFAISKTGTWFRVKNLQILKELKSISDESISHHAEALSFYCKNGAPIFQEIHTKEVIKVDIAFPILHGSFGEDGCIQGLFKMLNVPFVGCGVLASSVGMDKEIMKKVFTQTGIINAPFLLLTQSNNISYQEIVEKLGSPFFIKPANAGSSVGVHKIKSALDLESGLSDAFKYDSKILAEKFIKGREIEVAVLGSSDTPRAATPGEIIPTHEFYSYEAKYLDENGARIEIPAALTTETKEKIQQLACRAFTVLGCEGLARADFFVTSENEIYINEVNTIPGFTNISMYPKMWEHAGIKYQDLISELIHLGLTQFKKDSALLTNFI